jgi:hypothetical protein
MPRGAYLPVPVANVMEFVVGESVLLKERSGIFTVLDFDPEVNLFVIEPSGILEPPSKVHRDSLLKIPSEITERIRSEVLADVEQQRLEAEKPKPACRYTDDQVLTAKARVRVIEPLYEIEKTEGRKITSAEKYQAMESLGIKMTVLNDLLSR